MDVLSFQILGLKALNHPAAANPAITALRVRVLHDLDRGEVEAARSLLRSGLDSDIITVWAFGDYSDSRSRKMATNVLAGIAAFRAGYPSNYVNRTTQEGAEIDAKITEILDQARRAQAR